MRVHCISDSEGAGSDFLFLRIVEGEQLRQGRIHQYLRACMTLRSAFPSLCSKLRRTARLVQCIVQQQRVLGRGQIFIYDIPVSRQAFLFSTMLFLTLVGQCLLGLRRS